MEILISIAAFVGLGTLFLFYSSPKLRYRGKRDRRVAQRRQVADRRVNKRGRRKRSEHEHESKLEDRRKNFTDRRTGPETRRHHLRREEDRHGKSV